MKTPNILSIFTALFLLASIVASANTSILKINNDGDSKIVKSNSKEKTFANSENTTSSASAETEFGYLRFDVSKYAKQDIENNESDAAIEISDDEFTYLKFDVVRYVIKDISDDTDTIVDLPDPDYSYLRFDVTKYAGNDEGLAGDTMNP